MQSKSTTGICNRRIHAEQDLQTVTSDQRKPDDTIARTYVTSCCETVHCGSITTLPHANR